MAHTNSFGRSLSPGKSYTFGLSEGSAVTGKFDSVKLHDGAVVVKDNITDRLVHLNPAHIVLAREVGS
jgi:hypothetical protein